MRWFYACGFDCLFNIFIFIFTPQQCCTLCTRQKVFCTFGSCPLLHTVTLQSDGPRSEQTDGKFRPLCRKRDRDRKRESAEEDPFSTCILFSLPLAICPCLTCTLKKPSEIPAPLISSDIWPQPFELTFAQRTLLNKRATLAGTWFPYIHIYIYIYSSKVNTQSLLMHCQLLSG